MKSEELMKNFFLEEGSQAETTVNLSTIYFFMSLMTLIDLALAARYKFCPMSVTHRRPL